MENINMLCDTTPTLYLTCFVIDPYSKSQTRSSWKVAETFANPMTIFISSILRKVATKLKGPKDILMPTGSVMVKAKT